jgi:hypothetical protein
MRFEIIFVRHAESCANVWKDQTLIGHIRYSDPEITKRGTSLSVARYPKLKEAIKKYLPSYTVGASALMRAQQSAYYMLAKHVRKPINVIPHVSEQGITTDNIPFEKSKQVAMLEKMDPKVVSALNKGKDARNEQTTLTKSNFKDFLKWAEDNPDFFAKGKDGVYRAVIFTHGKLLKSQFPLKNADPQTDNDKYNNNDFVVTAFGDEKEGSQVPQYPNFVYFDTSGIGSSEEECPGESCRLPISCKKKGGTRKHKHSIRYTKKNKHVI